MKKLKYKEPRVEIAALMSNVHLLSGSPQDDSFGTGGNDPHNLYGAPKRVF